MPQRNLGAFGLQTDRPASLFLFRVHTPAPSMPKSELQASRRRDARAEYSYRRELDARELLPAFGVAVAAGLFAFYITRLLLQRTRLDHPAA